MTFEPGIYPEMTREQYDQIIALNQSTIKTILKRHARRAYYDLTHPTPSTQPMIDGSAFHRRVLEPDRFDEGFALPPLDDNGNRVRKQGKANLEIWKAWNEENADRHEISVDTMAGIEKMATALWDHPTVGRWLDACQYTEFTVLWEHPEYGFPCKAQMDAVSIDEGWTWLWDLKKTKDATAESFSRDIANYDYLVQAEWYLEGLNALAEAERRFAFVAVEVDQPNDIAIYELDALARFEAKHRIDKATRIWAKALETGEFPGMDTGVQSISAPKWAMTHERDLPEDGDL